MDGVVDAKHDGLSDRGPGQRRGTDGGVGLMEGLGILGNSLGVRCVGEDQPEHEQDGDDRQSGEDRDDRGPGTRRGAALRGFNDFHGISIGRSLPIPKVLVVGF